MTTAVGEDGAL